jgi:hypothetical protein
MRKGWWLVALILALGLLAACGDRSLSTRSDETDGEPVCVDAPAGSVVKVEVYLPTAQPTQTPEPTPTHTATVTPTFTPIPAATVAPSGGKGLAPGHYQMLDAGTPNREKATSLFYLNELEPQPGVYDFTRVETWLAKHPQGVLQVFFHTSGQTGDAYFQLWLPDGYPAYTVTSGNKRAHIPAYDDPAFIARYTAFIAAFGARYNGHPVIASTGLDGETQPAKTAGGIDWINACYNTPANAVPYRFRTVYLDAVLRAYRDAFPDSVVFVNCAPGGNETRIRAGQLALELGLGIKHSGLVYDAANHWGYDAQGNRITRETWDTYAGHVGSWDMARVYSDTLPIFIESAYPQRDAEPLLWAGLSYHPQAMAWHKEMFTVFTTDELEWAAQYLGVTTDTTPGVWWAAHESPYPRVQSGSKGYLSGHTDDWCFWLYRDGSTWRVDERVTLFEPTLRVRYTGGPVTVYCNGYEYELGASDKPLEARVRLQGVVSELSIKGGQVAFVEVAR